MAIKEPMVELDFYLYIKPLLSEKECGDTGVILESEKTLFVALLDVLGHGAEAYEVAQKARLFLESNYLEDLVELTMELHQAILNTRGLVGSLVRLDISSGLLDYVGMGNIVSRRFGSEYYKFVNRDGIIGYKMPKPRMENLQLKKGDILLMHSDGIRENSGITNNNGVFDGHAESITKELVQKFSRQNDDSACFLLKYDWK